MAGPHQPVEHLVEEAVASLQRRAVRFKAGTGAGHRRWRGGEWVREERGVLGNLRGEVPVLIGYSEASYAQGALRAMVLSLCAPTPAEQRSAV